MSSRRFRLGLYVVAAAALGLACGGGDDSAGPIDAANDGGTEGGSDGAPGSTGPATLHLTSPAAGRQVAGQLTVSWTASGLGAGDRVRLTGWKQGTTNRAACGETFATTTVATFDLAACAPMLAPGEVLVVHAEAVDAAGAPLVPPAADEVALTVAGATTGTLYDPDPKTNPDDEASYPHAIELRHSGAANGTILATFERQIFTSTAPRRGWLLFQSIDGGAHVARLGAPVEPAHYPDATFALQPNLLELAKPAGAFPAGTIYLAGDTISGTKFELQVFRSIDGGATFQLASTLDLGDTSVDPRRPWEPFLLQLDDGRIVAFFSDEITPGGRQNISRKISTDGGATWGAKVDVWRSADDGDRPGMATVTRMGDQRYIMAVEMCGAPGDFCRAHIKTSTDGLTWGGGAADLGTRPVTTTNHPFHGNPAITWAPKGGPDGTLILSARDLQESVAAPDTPAGNHGQTLLVNYGYGSGPWYELTAAMPWAAGASYTQAGYRSFALPLGSGDALLYFAATYTGAGNRNRILFGTTNPGLLPFADPFAGSVDVGFERYGGGFTAKDGVYTDSVGGAGDKAVAGSTAWTNTTTSADVRLDGSGNAGLIVRVTDPSVGADAYDGYYVGLSSVDGTAFVGRTHHDFNVVGTTHAVAGGVAIGAWYHVSVKAVGCRFDVQVTPDGGAPTSFSATDASCTQTFGAVGVRTFQTKASWRALRVHAE